MKFNGLKLYPVDHISRYLDMHINEWGYGVVVHVCFSQWRSRFESWRSYAVLDYFCPLDVLAHCTVINMFPVR